MKPAPSAKRRPHRLLIGGAAVSGLGVVLLGAAIGTNLQVNRNIQQLNPFVIELDDGQLEIPGDKEDLYRDTLQTQRASQALYGIGSIVAVAGVTLMIVDAVIGF